MLSLSKEQAKKSTILVNDDIEAAFLGILADVEKSVLKRMNATLSNDELRAIAAQVDILRNLSTFKKAIIDGNRNSALS